MQSTLHKGSREDASNFVALLEAKAVSIDEQLNSSFRRQIQENRNKLGPIISTILFCGMHDLALRGKESNSGNFYC